MQGLGTELESWEMGLKNTGTDQICVFFYTMQKPELSKIQEIMRKAWGSNLVGAPG